MSAASEGLQDGEKYNTSSIYTAKLHCKKVALSCRFPADFKLPRLGSRNQVLQSPAEVPLEPFSREPNATETGTVLSVILPITSFKAKKWLEVNFPSRGESQNFSLKP